MGTYRNTKNRSGGNHCFAPKWLFRHICRSVAYALVFRPTKSNIYRGTALFLAESSLCCLLTAKESHLQYMFLFYNICSGSYSAIAVPLSLLILSGNLTSYLARPGRFELRLAEVIRSCTYVNWQIFGEMSRQIWVNQQIWSEVNHHETIWSEVKFDWSHQTELDLNNLT